MRLVIAAVVAVVSLTIFGGTALATSLQVPAAPSDLTQSGYQVINWHDNSDNEDGFRLQKLIWGEWLTVTEYPANTTSAPFPLLGYDPGCLIPLRILAFNAAGESEPSAPMPYTAPTPTPPPSGCPFTDTLTLTNDTGHATNRLVLAEPHGYHRLTLSENASGCAEPAITLSPNPYQFEVVWPTTCVDPGESVVLTGTGTGPSVLLTGEWSVEEAPSETATPSATPSPTPSPTVTPASLPVAGGSPNSGPTAVLVLVAGAILVALGTLALKRIR